MCDFSGKLIAWMDGELPENEAAAIAQHIQSCAEGPTDLAAFEDAINAFNAYCDVAVAQANTFTPAELSIRERRAFHWTPVAYGIGAIAAAAVLIVLVMQPGHQVAKTPPGVSAQPQPLHAIEQSHSIATANSTASSVAPPVTTQRHSRPEPHGKKSVKFAQQQQPRAIEQGNVAAFAAQPPIEISVPVEDMFPPGAVPDGISYNAVVTFAVDNSSPRYGNADLNGMNTSFNRGGNRP